MLGYTLAGAVIGAAIGSLIPPGHLFWFAVGAGCGWLAHQYARYRRY